MIAQSRFILNAATQPDLYIIQDPSANLQPEERVEVRYLVPVGDIIEEWDCCQRIQ